MDIHPNCPSIKAFPNKGSQSMEHFVKLAQIHAEK